MRICAESIGAASGIIAVPTVRAPGRNVRAFSNAGDLGPTMDSNLLDELKNRLGAERERLLGEVTEIERHERETLSEASGENNYRDHMADQGSATFERELDMTLEENVRDALKAVDDALESMEAGTYGTCERCGKPIAQGRLEAVPTATLCIACKEAEESR